MKPGHVEIIGEIAQETPSAVLFHEGIKERGAWLWRAEIEIFKDDPIPGLVTVWMPGATATRHGFWESEP